MKTLLFRNLGERVGDPSVLEFVDTPITEPGPGEVLIRNTSVGLNRADLIFVTGRYFQKATLPSRVGMEPAGIVEKVGDGVEWKPGDRVGVYPGAFSMSAQGGLAEYSTLPATSLVASPANLDDRDTGAIWMQYLTVLGALQWQVQVKAGQFVVITAASSSVGLAAIEYVNSIGAIPIATTTSADKVERLKAHGAAHVINMKAEDYPARIKEITSRRGVDVVFDSVAGPAVAEHVRACAESGTIILYGLLDSRPTDCFPGLLIGKNIRLVGYTIAHFQKDRAALDKAAKEIADGVASGRFRPVIDRRFPLDQAREAFEYMASNQQFGKIVIHS